MSKVVDDRVVEMRFDNRQFESNVQTSISTLDRLKKSLNLDKASKGFTDIDKGAIKAASSTSSISNAVGKVQASFSGLQVMAVTALANIANSATNAGKKLVAAFTIDPIKTGFQEYETQINAVQTILSNTQKEHTNIETVNKALDELNLYADKTIYNFTEMTRNIGTFTAAGVKLDTSVAAIKGIANLAALSGSNAQQASTAMYQLSQALASGTVKLMDWNSVVNAGMGGQVFQDSLKETARVHGIAIDDMIKKEGSFRETLQKGWLSAEILTETLSKFTGELSEEQLKSMGYTQDQIAEIQKLGQMANDAATKVKTFTQLMDTLKEAAQSGWSQSWRIIVGDFEEAKVLWTEVSDVFGKMISDSANARNEVLQGWADAGGRQMLIDSLKNAFEGLMSVIKPIKDAFREIFPPITVQQLLNFTQGLKDLTSKFKLSQTQAENLKATFKGLFSIVDIIITVIKNVVSGIGKIIGAFSGAGNGILSFTGFLGNLITKFRDVIKESDIFNRAFSAIANVIQAVTGKIKEVVSTIRSKLESIKFEGFYNAIQKIWQLLLKLGSKIGEVFGNIGSTISNIFERGWIDRLLNIFNTGIFTMILLSAKKWLGLMNGTLSGGLKDIVNSIKNIFQNSDKITAILDQVKGVLKAWQNELNSKALINIAKAIAILAAALFVLSSLDPVALASSLGAITALFGELIGSMAVFNKFDSSNLKNVTKMSTLMIAMSTSLLLLSSAVAKIGKLNWQQAATGVAGISILLWELVAVTKVLSMSNNADRSVLKITGFIKLSIALNLLANAVKTIGKLNWQQAAQGLIGVSALLWELVAVSKILSKSNNTRQAIQGMGQMIALATSLVIVAAALKIVATIDWGGIARGLTGITVALGIMVGVFALMGQIQNKGSSAGSMLVMALNLILIASALKMIASMDWDGIKKSLVGIGATLAIMVAALGILGSLQGSAIASAGAIIMMAAAINMLVIPMKILGSMSWESIVKGLVTIAGALTILSAAAAVLAYTGLAPVILAIGAAIALVGAGCLAAGLGLIAAAAGITALAAAITASAGAIIAGTSIIVNGLISLAGDIIKGIARGIVSSVDELYAAATSLIKIVVLAFTDNIPLIAEAILKAITSVFSSLVQYTPQIVGLLFDFLIAIIDGLASKMPELTAAIVNLFMSLFKGVTDALSQIDIELFAKGIVGITMLSSMMISLAAAAALTPLAMIGVLGVVAVLGELGAISKIPGLTWLIGEGAPLLENIGKTIGSFIGGLAGGVASSFSNSMPQIAKNLSSFMTNLQPFVEGASNIKADTFSGIPAMAKAISSLTASKIFSDLSNLIPKSSTIGEFAKSLVPVGEALKAFSDSVKELDSEAIEAAAKSGKALSEFAKTIPNMGGVISWFTGDNKMDDFGNQLNKFGSALSDFSKKTKDVNPESVEKIAQSSKKLSELIEEIPQSGGFMSRLSKYTDLYTFANQLTAYGTALSNFSKSIAGVNVENIGKAADAGKALTEFANSIPNSGGAISWLFTGDNKLDEFGEQLKSFGKSLVDFSKSATDINVEALGKATAAGKAITEFANSIPNTSGPLAWLFTGDNRMDKFGEQLKSFGKSLVDFSKSATDINVEALGKAAAAGKALTEFANSIPNTSGPLAWLFTGDNKLDDFGKQLKKYGKALIDFSKSLENVNIDTVGKAAKVGQALAEFANSIPNTSGPLAWLFTGDNRMDEFGKQLKSFGKALSTFSNSIKDVKADNITNATAVAKEISNFAKAIPNLDNFKGSKLHDFGRQIKSFIYSLNDISGVVNNITLDHSKIRSVSSFAEKLSEISTNASGDIKLHEFGRQIKSFIYSLNDISGVLNSIIIDKSKIQSILLFASSLIDLDSKTSNDIKLHEFGRQIKSFIYSLNDISGTLNNIDISENTTTNVSRIAAIGERLASMTGTIPSNFENMSGFAEQIGTFADKVSGIKDKLNGLDIPEETITKVDSVAKIIERLAAMTSAIPKDIGISTDPNLGGLQTTSGLLSSFTSQLKTFSEDIGGVLNSISSITMEEGIYDKVVNISKCVQELGAMTESIPDSFKNMTGGPSLGGIPAINTTGPLTNFTEQIKQFAIDFDGIATSLSGVTIEWAQIKNISDCVKELSTMVSAVNGEMTNVGGMQVGGFSSFGESTSPLKSLTTQLSTFATDIQPIFTSISSLSVDEGLYDKVVNISKCVQELGTMMSSVTSSMGGVSSISGIPSYFSDSGMSLAGTPFTNFITQIQDFAEKIGPVFESLSGITADWSTVENLSKCVQELGKMAQSIIDVGGENDLSSIGDKLKDFIEDIEESIEDLKDIKVDDVKKTIDDLVKAISDIKIDTSGIEALSEALKKLASESLQGFNSEMTKGVESAKATLEMFINSLQVYVTSVGMTSLNNAFKDLAYKSIEGFTTGISEKTQDATDAIAKLGNDIVNALNEQKVAAYDAGYEVGSQICAGIVAGIQDGQSSVIAAAISVANAAASAAKAALGINSPSKVFTEYGKFIDEGLANGIKDNSKIPVKSSEKIASSIINAPKKVLDINSPSKVMRDEVGRYIVMGISEGITMEMSAEEAAEKKAKNIVDAFKAELDKLDLKSDIAESLYNLYALKEGATVNSEERAEEQIKMLQEQTDYYKEKLELAKGEYYITSAEFGAESDEAREAYKKMLDSEISYIKKSREAKQVSYELSMEWIEREKKHGRLALEEEYKAYQRVQDRYERNSEKWLEMEEKKWETRNSLMDKSYQHSLDWIENEQKYDRLGTGNKLAAYIRMSEELKYAIEEAHKDGLDLDYASLDNYLKNTEDTIYDLTKNISKAQKEHEEELRELRKDYNEKRKEYEDDYDDKCKEIKENRDKEIDDLEKKYEDALKSRTNALYNSYSLFSKIEQKEKASASELTKNIQDQVAVFEDWRDNMDRLSDRGLNPELIEELQEMGPDAIAEIKALNSMTDSQLSQYANLWSDKHKLASDKATAELKDMRKTTNSEISQIRSDASDQLKKAKEDLKTNLRELREEFVKNTSDCKIAYKKAIGELPVYTEEELTEMKNVAYEVMNRAGFTELGQNLVNGIIDGVKSNAPDYYNVIRKLMKNGEDAAKEEADVNSPSRVFAEIGKNLDMGLVVGINNYRNRVMDATTRVGDESIASMRKAISNVNDIVVNNTDFTPRIRPIVDLSDIDRGISYMDSALESERILALSIKSSSNQNGIEERIDRITSKITDANARSNSEIVDALSDLRSDLNELTDKVTNLQVIMDSGALVGAIAPEMDSAIGDRVKMSRRRLI